MGVATKLARSIHLALHSVGVDEDWRALELANVALLALRQRHDGEAGDKPARAKSSAKGGGAVATMLTTAEAVPAGAAVRSTRSF